MSVSSIAPFLKDQKLLKAGFDGNLATEYLAGDSISVLAERYETYPAKVRDQLIRLNVRIRDRNELRKAGMLKAQKTTASNVTVLTTANSVLDKLLAAGVITQADIDARATPAPVPAPKLACPRMTKHDAAQEIHEIAKRSGGRITGRMMGDIFGYSESWFGNFKK